jgi:hypothetical protein
MKLTEEMTKSTVMGRIHDWKARLEALFDQVESWISDPAVQVQRAYSPQTFEEPMKRHKVKPGMIPSLTLLKGKRRIVFSPHMLWILGVDGQVDIRTENEHFVLVDMREDPESESNWRIIDRDIRVGTRKFSKALFKQILGKSL